MTAPKTPPRPAGKVPRPTPPKYHVDRDKTPVPGTYLDHGEGFGGNPARKAPSLPPGLKLGPQIHTAVQAAELLSHELPTRGYDAAEVRAIAQQEARARGQSAKFAAAKGLEDHERKDDHRSTRDKLIIGAISAIGVALVGGLAMLGTALVNNASAAAEARSEDRVTKAATERVEALLRPLVRITDRLDAEETRRARDVAELHQRIDRIPTANPDLVTRVEQNAHRR